MEQDQSTNSTEQRRKLLKGALATSGVVAMGYSGSALASFQCVSSTAVSTPPLQARSTQPSDSGGLRWLKVPLYAYTKDITKVCNNGQVLSTYTYAGVSYSVLGGIQIDSSSPIYMVLDTSNTAGNGSVLLIPNPISGGGLCGSALSNKFVYLLAYFEQDGTYVGAYTDSAPVMSQAATGSCLTSVNPNLQPPGGSLNQWIDG